MATEIISGIVQTLITKLGEGLARKIKNQLTHLCFHHFYVQRLTEEVQKLETERQTVQQAVDAALRTLDSIRPDVKDWLMRVDNWLTNSHKILDKAHHRPNNTTGKSFFLKWLLMVHYSLSVEAQNAVEASVQLQITPGKFDRVSDPSNPADLEPVPLSSIEILLESRALLEKQVMDALQDDAVYLIGLCGMGGVGKTTLATKMMNWAKSSNMFKVVIFTVVSQRLEIKEVQQQIAEGLGLKLEDHSLDMRAKKIYARLKDEKSFLIIFDDVWQRLDLAKLGIPSKSTTEKCKLILTSRIRDALITLTNDCYKIFTVDILPNEEAWKLFREKAGDSIEAPELVEIAKQVARQCKGLPLALIVVGSALRDKRKNMWEDALVQLKRSHMPSYIPRVLEDLYVPLKWSYEQLPSEEVRYIFLLFCLFPEDREIPTEILVRYGWGLHVFNNVETMREARDRVSILVDILKCRFLLTQAKPVIPFYGDEECVKVHDVIRDMGILIACEDSYVFMISQGNWPRKSSYENVTHIYVELEGKLILPETLNCPRLEFLHIGVRNSDFEEDMIPEKFFSSMNCLKILSISGFKATIFPSCISMLTSLQGIYIEFCFLGNMESIFGNMVNLEIISIKYSRLDVLPREIGQLKKLKVLDLTGCENISIESGVISKLVKLEELLIEGCNELWKEKEEEAMVVLAEIGSLNSLVNLQITLVNPKLLSLDQPFLPKLERFLFVGGDEEDPDFPYFEGLSLYKKVAWIRCKVAQLSNFILAMIRNVECLVVEGDPCIVIVNELGNIKFQELKLLYLSEFGNVEYLVVPTTASQSQRVLEKKDVLFPALESLFLGRCENLKEICFHQPSNGSFGSLKQLHLEDMDNLIHALPVSKFQMCSHLEVLKIIDCPVMEDIFWEQQQEEQEQGGGVQIATIDQNKIKFLRLRKIKLDGIPKMEVFCKGIEEIELLALEKLRIISLPKMKNFASTSNCNIDEDQFFFRKEIICPNLKTLKLEEISCNGIFKYNIPKGYFNWLEVLTIFSCNNLKNVMAHSLSKSLKNLTILHIQDCEELEEVIRANQDEEGQTNIKEILFPRLQTLKLIDLPKMYTFCHMTAHLELPSSLEVTIEKCPLLKTFSFGSLSCPNIKVSGIQDPSIVTKIFFHK